MYIYIYIYKVNLALNNHQGLISHKTQPNQTKPKSNQTKQTKIKNLTVDLQ